MLTALYIGMIARTDSTQDGWFVAKHTVCGLGDQLESCGFFKGYAGTVPALYIL